jgi:hypothetical protein
MADGGDLRTKVLTLPGYWMRVKIDGKSKRVIHLFCRNYTLAFCGYNLETEAGGFLFSRTQVAKPGISRCAACGSAAKASRFNQADAL